MQASNESVRGGRQRLKHQPRTPETLVVLAAAAGTERASYRDGGCCGGGCCGGGVGLTFTLGLGVGTDAGGGGPGVGVGIGTPFGGGSVVGGVPGATGGV